MTTPAKDGAGTQHGERCDRCFDYGSIYNDSDELVPCPDCLPSPTPATPTPDAAMIERVKREWTSLSWYYVNMELPEVQGTTKEQRRAQLSLLDGNLRALIAAVEHNERPGCEFCTTGLNAKGSGESNAGPVVNPLKQAAAQARIDCKTLLGATPTPTGSEALVGECEQKATVLYDGHGPSARGGAVLLRRAAAEIERLLEQEVRFKEMCFAHERERKRAEQAEARAEREYKRADTFQQDALKYARQKRHAERERDEEKKLRLVKEGMLESAELECEGLTRERNELLDTAAALVDEALTACGGIGYCRMPVRLADNIRKLRAIAGGGE